MHATQPRSRAAGPDIPTGPLDDAALIALAGRANPSPALLSWLVAAVRDWDGDLDRANTAVAVLAGQPQLRCHDLEVLALAVIAHADDAAQAALALVAHPARTESIAATLVVALAGHPDAGQLHEALSASASLVPLAARRLPHLFASNALPDPTWEPGVAPEEAVLALTTAMDAYRARVCPHTLPIVAALGATWDGTLRDLIALAADIVAGPAHPDPCPPATATCVAPTRASGRALAGASR